MDRPIWGFEGHDNSNTHYGNGRAAAYEVYIIWEGWRTMDPDRMRQILKKMLGSSNYSVGQHNRIAEVLNQIE